MSQVVLRSETLPARVTGRPVSWSRDGAIVGAVTGYVGPASVLFGLSLHPWLLACTLGFALGGAVLGAWLSAVLEQVRGRVPLPVLAVVVPALAVGSGSLWAAFLAWMVEAPVALSMTFAVVAIAFQVGVFWFPYTMLAVLGRARWPLVVAACTVSPLLGLLARWVFLFIL